MSELLPYTVYRMESSASFNSDTVNSPAMGTCFEGWDFHFSLVNHLAETIFVYSEAGKFLKEIPVQKHSIATATLTNGVTVQWETMTDIAKTSMRAMRRDNSSLNVYPHDLADKPLLLAELGIILTTSKTRSMVIDTQTQLKDLLYGRRIAAVDGVPQYPDAMILYGNFEGNKNPRFYLAINDSIIQISGRHTDLVPPNTGLLFIDEAQGDGRFQRRLIHYDKEKMHSDPDGVFESLSVVDDDILPKPANYVLSDNYSLVVQYLAKMRRVRQESGVRVPSTGKVVATTSEMEEIIAQRVRVCTQELTDRTNKAELLSTAASDELVTAKKQIAELEKERKTLLAYVDRGLSAETIDQRFLDKEEERLRKQDEHELNQRKARLDMTQKTVGIAAGTFSLLAVFINPLKSLFGWLASKLGFMAAAAV